MSEPNTATHTLRPTSSRWTHIAWRVKDIEASIDFYLRYTSLELLNKRENEDGYGAWLGHPDQKEFPFVLVLAQFFPDKDPFGDTPLAKMAPFNHVGIELPTRQDVDNIATQAESEGRLAMAATRMPDPIGYICMVEDPDGNLVEFSFDQGVYETVRSRLG